MLFGACNSDEGAEPVLVTDVEMPPRAQTFSPGDEVTVRARGFLPDDDIVLRITWPIAGSVDSGYAVLLPEVTFRSTGAVGFIVPSGYAAGDATVQIRRGDDIMTLGAIGVSEGLPPEKFSLYGIRNSDEGCVFSRIDPATGMVTRLRVLEAGQDIAMAVNSVGTNRLGGIDGSGELAVFDLTSLRYSRIPTPVLASGTISTTAVFMQLVDQALNAVTLSNYNLAREANRPSVWRLPPGVVPEELQTWPFVAAGNYLCYAVRTLEGGYAPLVLYNGEPYEVRLGDRIDALSLVPFCMTGDKQRMAGYVVGGAERSELRLFDPREMTLHEVWAEVPGTVVSCACLSEDGRNTSMIYLLSVQDGNKRVYACRVADRSLRVLTEDADFTQIVLAR